MAQTEISPSLPLAERLEGFVNAADGAPGYWYYEGPASPMPALLTGSLMTSVLLAEAGMDDELRSAGYDWDCRALGEGNAQVIEVLPDANYLVRAVNQTPTPGNPNRILSLATFKGEYYTSTDLVYSLADGQLLVSDSGWAWRRDVTTHVKSYMVIRNSEKLSGFLIDKAIEVKKRVDSANGSNALIRGVRLWLGRKARDDFATYVDAGLSDGITSRVMNGTHNSQDVGVLARLFKGIDLSEVLSEIRGAATGYARAQAVST